MKHVGPLLRTCSAWLFASLAAAGCSSLDTNLRTRYANEYSCPFERTSLQKLGGGALRVSGCDGAVTYVCVREAVTGFRQCSEENRELPERAAKLAEHPGSRTAPATPGRRLRRLTAHGQRWTTELTGTTKLERRGARLWPNPSEQGAARRVILKAARRPESRARIAAWSSWWTAEARPGEACAAELDGFETLSAYVAVKDRSAGDAERVAGACAIFRFMRGRAEGGRARGRTRFREERAWDAPTAMTRRRPAPSARKRPSGKLKTFPEQRPCGLCARSALAGSVLARYGGNRRSPSHATSTLAR